MLHLSGDGGVKCVDWDVGCRDGSGSVNGLPLLDLSSGLLTSTNAVVRIVSDFSLWMASSTLRSMAGSERDNIRDANRDDNGIDFLLESTRATFSPDSWKSFTPLLPRLPLLPLFPPLRDCSRPSANGSLSSPCKSSLFSKG